MEASSLKRFDATRSFKMGLRLCPPRWIASNRRSAPTSPSAAAPFLCLSNKLPLRHLEIWNGMSDFCRERACGGQMAWPIYQRRTRAIWVGNLLLLLLHS